MWKFTDSASLKVGKDYSPVTDFISNQWYNADNDMLGEGNFYGRRPAGLTLGIGDFELAALVPSYGSDARHHRHRHQRHHRQATPTPTFRDSRRATC